MDGGAGGAVFGGDPALIILRVKVAEQGGQVKAAAAGFGAGREAGNLDVVDMRLVFLPHRPRIAMDAGGVPQVELQADPRVVDVGQDAGGLIEVVQEIARHVFGVQRLDAQGQVGGLGCGPSQVFGVKLGRLSAARHPGHDMQAGSPQPGGKVGGAQKTVAKAAFQTGHGGVAPVTGSPVAGVGVDQRQGHCAQSRLPILGGVVIGKQDLDPVKTGLRGQTRPVETGHFGEEHGQIGGVSGHQGRRAERMTGMKSPCDQRPNQLSPDWTSWQPNSTRR